MNFDEWFAKRFPNAVDAATAAEHSHRHWMRTAWDAALKHGAALPEELPRDLVSTLRLRCGYIINGYSDAKLEAKEMLRLLDERGPATVPQTTCIGMAQLSPQKAILEEKK